MGKSRIEITEDGKHVIEYDANGDIVIERWYRKDGSLKELWKRISEAEWEKRYIP